MFDQNAKLLVNNYILVSEAKSFDIHFDYNEQNAYDSKEAKPNSLQGRSK